MSITLRKANVDELGVMHAIRRDAILGIESESLALSDLKAWADRRSTEFLADRVAAGAVVIAVSEDNPIAWGSSFDDWITGIYVRPSSSHTGVGRTIMSRLESDIVKRGHACAYLESSPNAVGFYAKLGYTPVGLPDDDGTVPIKKSFRMANAQRRAV